MNDENGQRENPRVVDAEIVDSGTREGQNARSNYYVYQPSMGRVWMGTYGGDQGCLAAFITFFLFMVCLGSYGLLAAIGFFVFHIIGSIMGAFQSSRCLMVGAPWNPWPWRCGNWIISFLLTVFLAGGFD